MTFYASVAGAAIFTLAMGVAAVVDLTTMTIRNRLVLLLLGFYAVLAPLAGFGLATLATSALVASLVLVGGLALFWFGWVGGGDVKLAAVASLWVGSSHALEYLSTAAIFGGLLAVLMLCFRALPLPSWMQPGWLARLHRHDTGLPYGVALAAAAFAILPATLWGVVL